MSNHSFEEIFLFYILKGLMTGRTQINFHLSVKKNIFFHFFISTYVKAYENYEKEFRLTRPAEPSNFTRLPSGFGYVIKTRFFQVLFALWSSNQYVSGLD